jgi:hypothetical protein
VRLKKFVRFERLKKFKRFNKFNGFKRLGIFGLPMLVFSPIIKGENGLWGSKGWKHFS